MQTFRDHGEGFGWFAYCRHCYHQRALVDAYIAKRIGLDADVHRVRLRLRRRVCGDRNALLYRHCRSGMDGPSPFAYRLPPELPEVWPSAPDTAIAGTARNGAGASGAAARDAQHTLLGVQGPGAGGRGSSGRGARARRSAPPRARRRWRARSGPRRAARAARRAPGVRRRAGTLLCAIVSSFSPRFGKRRTRNAIWCTEVRCRRHGRDPAPNPRFPCDVKTLRRFARPAQSSPGTLAQSHAPAGLTASVPVSDNVSQKLR